MPTMTKYPLGFLLAAACVAVPAAQALAQQQGQQQGQRQGQQQGQQQTHEAEVLMPKLGVVVLQPTQGNKARGTLRLMQQGDQLKVTGTVRNLTPGEHGFHIHEYGDRRAQDGTSAGGHFNPDNEEHGAPGEDSHAGDLGNITANDQGVAKVDVTVSDTKLHYVIGRSFVVHAGKDDLESQPSGDAGARVAVGVIGIGNPEFKPQGQQGQQRPGQQGQQRQNQQRQNQQRQNQLGNN